MKEIYYLTKRNMQVFLRDYAAVFFSVLSMFIILLLMVVFLGKMNVDEILWVLETYGEKRDVLQDKKNAAYFVQMWTLSGILAVNTVTVALTVLQGMIRDEANGQLACFYVAPVKRIKIALGYILASGIISSIMSFLTLILGEVYMLWQGFALLPVMDCLQVLGLIVLNAFTYASIGYLAALFVHSESAWGGILTVVGTLVGFLGGIYLPISQLAEGMVKILKCLPVLHGAAMLRVILTKDAMDITFQGLPAVVPETVAKEMGIILFWGDRQISLKMQILLLAVYAIIAIAAAAIVSKRRKIHDR